MKTFTKRCYRLVKPAQARARASDGASGGGQRPLSGDPSASTRPGPRAGTRARDLRGEALEPVAGQQRPVLLVPGRHRVRADRGAPAGRASATPSARTPATLDHSRPRSISDRTRAGRGTRAPRWCRPSGSPRRSRPRATRTSAARRAGPRRGRTVADAAGREHPGTPRRRDSHVVAHRHRHQLRDLDQRVDGLASQRRVTERPRRSVDQNVDRRRPSRRERRRRPRHRPAAGRPPPPAARSTRAADPRPRIAPPRAPRRSAAGPPPCTTPPSARRPASRTLLRRQTRDVEELPGRHLGAHAVDSGRAPQRGGRREPRRRRNSRSASTAARSPTRIAADHPNASGSHLEPARRPRPPARSGSRERRGARRDPSIRSSCTSAIVCRSSSAAAARDDRLCRQRRPPPGSPRSRTPAADASRRRGRGGSPRPPGRSPTGRSAAISSRRSPRNRRARSSTRSRTARSAAGALRQWIGVGTRQYANAAIRLATRLPLLRQAGCHRSRPMTSSSCPA